MTPPDEDTSSSRDPLAPVAYPGSSQDPPPPAEVATVSDVSVRVEQIVKAAEEAARSIRAKAEADAMVYARARRAEADEIVDRRHQEWAELRASLIRQGEAVQREISGLTARVEALMTSAMEGASAKPAPADAEIDSQPELPAGETPPPAAIAEPPAAPVETPVETPVAPTPAPEMHADPFGASGSTPPPPPPPAVDSPEPAIDAGSEEMPAPVPEPEPETRGRSRLSPFRRSSEKKAQESEAEAAVAESSIPDPSSVGAVDTPEPASAPPPPPDQVRDPDAAILMATQMAVAGSSRSDLRTALHREFGAEEAESAIQTVLGPAADE